MTSACPNCDQPVLVSDKFCAACGASVITSAPTSVPALTHHDAATRDAGSMSQMVIVALVSMLAVLFAWWLLMVRVLGLRPVFVDTNIGYLVADISIAAVVAILMTLAIWVAAAWARRFSLSGPLRLVLQAALLAPAGLLAFVLLSQLIFSGLLFDDFQFRYNNKEVIATINVGAAAALGASWVLARRSGKP